MKLEAQAREFPPRNRTLFKEPAARPGPELDLKAVLFTAALDLKLNPVTGPVGKDQVRKRMIVINLLTIDGLDDVSYAQPGFIRWAPRHNLCNPRTLVGGEVLSLRELFADHLETYAQERRACPSGLRLLEPWKEVLQQRTDDPRQEVGPLRESLCPAGGSAPQVTEK